jgi:flagellar biosynthesis protein FlhB
MAENNSQDTLEKNEEATPKRREDARAKGQFARSRIAIPAATLVAIAFGLSFAGESLVVGLQRSVIGYFSAAGSGQQITAEDFMFIGSQAGMLFAPVLLPLFVGVAMTALGSGFLQSGFVLASEPLRMDFSRVNPLRGLGRMFGREALAEMVKSVLLIGVFGGVGFALLYADIAELSQLSGLRVEDIFAYANGKSARLIAWMAGAIGAVAGLDYLYQRWHTETQLRMSRQEVKEEMRDQEGDPYLKGRLKSIRQKLAKGRMIADVVKADVIITNPTELAVALRYRAGETTAPKVLSKGAGFVAGRIREIARQNGIPIIEHKPLARLLYRQVEIGAEVPETLYRAVAEVLAYVFRLRRGERGPLPKFTVPQV